MYTEFYEKLKAYANQALLSLMVQVVTTNAAYLDIRDAIATILAVGSTHRMAAPTRRATLALFLLVIQPRPVSGLELQSSQWQSFNGSDADDECSSGDMHQATTDATVTYFFDSRTIRIL